MATEAGVGLNSATFKLGRARLSSALGSTSESSPVLLPWGHTSNLQRSQFAYNRGKLVKNQGRLLIPGPNTEVIGWDKPLAQEKSIR